ncbi:MAG: S8 family serine peptidase, partial [Acidimicrobiales bacterium]
MRRTPTQQRLVAAMATILVAVTSGATTAGAAPTPASSTDAPLRVIVSEDIEPGERPVFEVVHTDAAGFVELLLDPTVDQVGLDGTGRLQWSPTDPAYGAQWEHHHTGVEVAWDVTRGSSDVVMAIVDSGVNPGPEFGDRLLPGISFVGGDPTVDLLGHGTSVASVAAGAANNDFGGAGVCSECKILPVQAATPNGSVPWSASAEGVIWAVDNGADVINLSFGGQSESQLLADALAYAAAQGVVVVASAGNYGTDAGVYPAANPTVLSAAGHDPAFGRYPWSSYGPWVDVAAPGCTTAVSGTGIGTVCGTSFASPWTAGL